MSGYSICFVHYMNIYTYPAIVKVLFTYFTTKYQKHISWQFILFNSQQSEQALVMIWYLEEFIFAHKVYRIENNV